MKTPRHRAMAATLLVRHKMCKTNEEIESFRLGYLIGQCEKVAIGACKGVIYGCEQDSSEEFIYNTKKFVKLAAATFGLAVTQLDSSTWALHRPENPPSWLTVSDSSYRLGALLRGEFCGVPDCGLDPEFDVTRTWALPSSIVSNVESVLEEFSDKRKEVS